MASATSKVAPVKVTEKSGRASLKTTQNYYKTDVTTLADGSLKRETFRTDANGNNAVKIQELSVDSNGTVTKSNTLSTASAGERKALKDPNSPLRQSIKSQVKDGQKKIEADSARNKSQGDKAAGGSGNQASKDAADSPPRGPGPNEDPNGESTTKGPLSGLVYPDEARNNGQDMIRFTAVEYLASGSFGSSSSSSIGITSKNRKNLKGRSRVGGDVYLPIQSSIVDQNSVQWGGENLNEIERSAVNMSMGAMNTATGEAGATTALQNAVKEAGEKFMGSGPQIKVALAGQAVGINNLLSRFGQVLNPNLELLFTGPSLRPFNFTFKMSPRSDKEGKEVKQIINFFKKNMAPKGKTGETFLRTPNTFFIQYISRDKDGNIIDPHPSMNQIKECALTSCSVDYTPMGTYMTYEDDARTMVSYTMSLSFQELEPIYDADYDDKSTNIQY